VSAKKRLKSENSLQPIVNASGAAKFFGVAVGTVTTWLEEGLPAERRGKQGAEVQIDLRKAAPWVAKRRTAKPDAARTTVANEQAERLRLANAEKRQELVSVSYMTRVMNETAAEISSRLDALPGRAAMAIANLNDPGEIREKLLGETRAIRTAIADRLGELAERAPSAAH
jgi:phage terminase Nu1 subunit (DNA packaging protein)